MKRFLTMFAYRHPYSFHKKVLYILYTVAFILVVATFGVGIVTISAQSGVKELSIVTFIIFSLAVISTAAVIVYSRISSASKAEFEITKEYFVNETYLFNEAIIKKMANSSLKPKNGRGLLAVFAVRGLANIRSTFGQDGVKIINSAIKDAIIENLNLNNKDTVFGFSPIKGFVVFKKNDDTECFINEAKLISEAVNKRLEELGAMPNVPILVGVAVGKSKDIYDDLYEKASTASTYNLSTRIVSDTIVYSDDIMTDGKGERALSIELGNAINEEQLQIYYQPKFSLSSNTFYGAEALIRWNHPSRGLLPPSLFIPFAEQSNRIIDIDMYVFDHVCRDMAKWRKEGKRMLAISINLSRKTSLDPNIISFYKETMERYDIDPKLVDIELTESMAAQDSLFVSSIIRKIKSMGMDTSIDDFGTGYSSFSSLKKIPFDTLKIDKSFIDEIELDEKSLNIVKSINGIGHSLEMKTLAEGIETETQVKIAREIGIDGIQGYYFSRPLSEFEYQRFLANNEFEHNGKKEVKA